MTSKISCILSLCAQTSSLLISKGIEPSLQTSQTVYSKGSSLWSDSKDSQFAAKILGGGIHSFFVLSYGSFCKPNPSSQVVQSA